MEVLGTCHIDGVPLEICRFSIDNVSEELSCDDLFQRHMIEQWHAVFEARERDAPNLLSASRDCRVHTSTVGALWRECAFVLQPKEPLPNGPASHQQRLLALTVGAKEKLTPEELADRVRATYGATAVLHKQKLQRHGGVGGGRRGGNSAICQGAFFFVLEDDTPAEADAAAVGEEEGTAEVCKSEKQDATSALLVSRECLTGHQQKSLPAHAAIRHHPEAIRASHLPLTAELPNSTVPVGSVNLPFEPRLGDITQTTSDGREAPSHVESKSCYSVKVAAGTPHRDCTTPSAVPCTGESNPSPSLQQEHTLPKYGTPKETRGPVSRDQLVAGKQLKAPLVPGERAVVSIAMSSAVEDVTAENRTTDCKPCPELLPRGTLSFKSCEEKESLHAIEHKYNGLGAPCVLKLLKEECTKEKAEQVVMERRKLVDHEMFQCYSPTCSTCKTIRSLGEKHSQFCKLCGCRVPHCETMKKHCAATSAYKVNKASCPVPEVALDGCSPAPNQPKTAPQLATPTEHPISEELPLPTQDVAPPTVPPTVPPTASPTAPPLSMPATHPSREMPLKESIALVAAYQSLKEKPEEYLPPGGMIDKKILNKYFFGYSVMTDVFPVNKMEKSNRQKKGSTLGRGGNGDVYKASYKGCVFAVKETKYRPSEIQKWKMMSHPNLLPLLALQYHFHTVEPIEKGLVEASCWAFMPVMDIDLRSVLADLEPLVDRMSTATPKEAAEMMANAKHILREILKGLLALHDLGLVHRDIKEHNILLSSQCHCQDVFTCVCPKGSKCEVAIADFDSLAEDGAKHSSKRVPGTYGYRAPEAYTSNKVSPSIDVWAFGIIATKVFLGRNLDDQRRDAATLLNTDSHDQHQAAEVLVPQLKLKDLLSYGAGELHEAAMFVRECLEVDCYRRKTAYELLNIPFLSS